MTKHDLKELAAMGAKLGAAKAENERLRGLIEDAGRELQAWVYSFPRASHHQANALIARIGAALSQQAEPAPINQCDGCQAGIPADEKGYHRMGKPGGYADLMRCEKKRYISERAPAQDERNPTPNDYLAARSALESCDWRNVPLGTKAILGRVVDLLWLAAQARPAHTEQQPVAWQCRCVCEECVDAEWSQCSVEQYQMALADPDMQARALYAAPIAQTAPQGKFRMGDLVKKSSGSEWEGRVVGWYSTEQTKEGYAVESEAHSGSVQIYPAKALELVPMAAKEA